MFLPECAELRMSQAMEFTVYLGGEIPLEGSTIVHESYKMSSQNLGPALIPQHVSYSTK